MKDLENQLKHAIFNASNIRHLRSNDSIWIIVQGALTSGIDRAAILSQIQGSLEPPRYGAIKPQGAISLKNLNIRSARMVLKLSKSALDAVAGEDEETAKKSLEKAIIVNIY